jgi:HEAT repeat protein
LTGRSEALVVHFSSSASEDRRTQRLTIDGPFEIWFWPESLGTALKKKFIGEIQVGDPGFDKEVYVEGSPAQVRAVLDAGTRSLVRDLLRGRIRLGETFAGSAMDGKVTFIGEEIWLDIPDSSLDDQGQQLSAALRTLLDVARRLSRPQDVAARLAENLPAEPLATVRLQNLLTLMREYPGHPATREALRAACSDASDEIRLRAAMALSEEGYDVLLEIASREGADESCASRAVAALGEHLPPERAKAILERSLENWNVSTACACIEALGRNGSAEAVDTLVQVMLARGAISAAAAARALGTAGQAAAESHLIEALKHDSADLGVAVAEALGHVGSVKAVPSLQEAGARHSAERDLRRATRQAIAEIQSRLAGASPGQLSLAEGGVGQLSIAEGEVGQLSLAEGDAGELSRAKGER